MTIALRIANTKLSDLSFNMSLLSSEQILFNTLSCLPSVINTTEVIGTLNNGRQYSHLLYAISEHQITISSNELSEEAIAFLNAYWTSKYKYLSRFENNQWSDYIEVITDGGRFPIEYNEGNIKLPEISLLLKNKYPENL